METLIVSPKSASKLKTVKVILKALDVEFKSQQGKLYNPEYVKKIKASQDQIKLGKGVKISLDEIWK